MKIRVNSDGRVVKASPVANLDPGFFRFRTQASSSASRQMLLTPYARHPFVYACANAITMNIARLPKVMCKAGEIDVEFPEHSVTSLMAKPNELLSGSKIWEHTLLNLLLPTTNTLGGQCFWFGLGKDGKNHDFTSRNTLPYYLYVVSDRYIHPIAGENSGPGDDLFGWRLQFPNGKGITFRENEVLRFNLTNPYDLHRGLSPLASAWLALEQDGKAGELNSRFFDNNASLGGVLSTDQKMGGEAAAAMAQQWRQEYAGQDNAGKIAVLHTGLKYMQIEGSHADMQFIEQKKMNREDIMAAYRVPKSEVSLYEDINYATAISADKSFWQKTLLPYDMLILGVINNSWLKYYENGKYRLKSDYSVVEALAENYADKITQMVQLYSIGVPVAESARLLGIPVDVKTYPWLKTWLVQYSLIPADQASVDNLISDSSGTASSEDGESGADTSKLRKISTARYVLGKQKRTPISAPTPEEKVFDAYEASFSNACSRTRKEIEDYFERAVAPIERDYRRSLVKYFNNQKDMVISAVDAYFKNKKALVRASDIDIDPNIFYENFKQGQNKVLADVSVKFYNKEINNQKKEMEKELGSLEDWTIDSAGMKKLKARRLAQLKKINTTTFNAVGDKIRKTLKDLPYGATPQEAAKAIKDAVSGVYQMRTNQAMTIARTEIGTVASGTRNDIMNVEGIEQREWVAYLDEATRPEHVAAHGEVVNIGQAFSNGLMYPLDPAGEASQVINCRCVEVPYFKPD